MGLEGGPRLMKIALIVFNTLVLIVGVVAIGLGAWSLTSDYGAQEMSSITGSDLYEAACIVVIVGGCVVAFLALLGCCGALRESRCLLGLFASVLILLLVVFVTGIVLGFIFKDDLEDELEKEMTRTLQEKYDVDTLNNDDNEGVTEVWNKIQNKLKCCGVRGGLTSTTSWYLWQNSTWFSTQTAFEKAYVPTSCCNIDGYTFDQCQRSTDTTMPPQPDPEGLTNENPALYSEGCIDKVKDEIDDHIIAVAGAAIAAVVVMVLSIIFTLCVYTQIGKQSLVV